MTNLVLVLGIIGALVDLGLHLLQLWPSLVPSQAFVRWVTLIGGLLVLASCTTAFNAAALVIGLSITGMALFSLMTEKEVH